MWKSNLENMILQSSKIDAIQCLWAQDADIERASTHYLQERNMHFMKICKRDPAMEESGDIRYFIGFK